MRENEPESAFFKRLADSIISKNERGSVLTAALGVVALVGVLSYSTYNLLSGPVRTTANVTAVNKVRNDMIIAARLLMRNADDALDVDGTVEPPAFLAPGGGDAPTNGGYLPNVGVSTMDPWRTTLGYCAWDHGTSTGGANYLAGTGAPGTELVLAVISAGPDRLFSTVCSSGPAAIAVGGDDLVQEYSYAEAAALEGGLWNRIGATQDIEFGAGGDDVYVRDNLFAEGTTNIDDAVITTADINAGSIDGAIIGGTVSAAGTFTTLTANSLSTTGNISSSAGNLSGVNGVFGGTLGVTGLTTLDDTSLVDLSSSGTASFNIISGVTSTGLVTNLNADLLDGQEGSYYLDANNFSAGTLPEARLPAFSGGDVTMTAGDTSTLTVVGLQGRGLLSTAPAADQVIGWNGSNWAPLSISGSGGGGGIIITETDPNVDPKFLDADNSCSSGQVVKYNGSNWACAADDSTSGTADAVDLDIDVDPAPDGLVMSINGGSHFLSYKGTDNIFLGEGAGQSISTVSFGYGNVFVGKDAGTATDLGRWNVLLGNESGLVNTAGTHNQFIGYQSGLSNTTGSNHTFIGRRAGQANTTQSNNVFIGDRAGEYATVSQSVFIGYSSGQAASGFELTGDENTFVGYKTGEATTSGANNTFIGHDGGVLNTTGSANTFLGSLAGEVNTIGADNLFLGNAAGDNNIDGSRNIILGSNADNLTASTDDYLNIGNSLFGDMGTNPIGATPGVGDDADLTIAGDLTVTGTITGAVAGTISLPIDVEGEEDILNYGGLTPTETFMRQIKADRSIAWGEDAGAALLDANDAFDNVFVGYQAGTANTTGIRNTAVGSGALANNLGGTRNTAIGYWSLLDNSSGIHNTAVGVFSMADNDSGNYNTAQGYLALRSNVSGSDNVAIGEEAGYGVASSSNISRNVLLGRRAGLALLTGGDDNTFLGYQAGDNNTTGARNIILGSGADNLTATTDDYLNIGNAIYGVMHDGVGAPAIGDGEASITIDGDLNVTGNITGGGNDATSLRGELLDAALATNTTTDGQALIWSETNGQWEIGDATNLLNLGEIALDTDLNAATCSTSGHVPITDGAGNWTCGVPTAGDITLPIDADDATSPAGQIIELGGNNFLAYTGTANVFLGSSAGNSITSAQNSVFVGHGAGSLTSSGNYNTFLGTNAGWLNTSGSSNTFVGSGAGDANTTAAANTFVGYLAGTTNTTGQNNTALGVFAGRDNNGLQNTFLGSSAGLVSDANYNTMIGHYSGVANTSGFSNIFIGKNAADNNTTGARNIIIGSGVVGSGPQNLTPTTDDYLNIGNTIFGDMGTNPIGATPGVGDDADLTIAGDLTVTGTITGAVSGSISLPIDVEGEEDILNYGGTTPTETFLRQIKADRSIALGEDAGAALLDANDATDNVFVGYQAGTANTTGIRNVFIGSGAGITNTTGGRNTYIGRDAGTLSTASYNTFIGNGAGSSNVIGTLNTFVGSGAGSSNTNFSGNTLIGMNAGLNASAAGNTFLGYYAGGITTSGGDNVFIGEQAADNNTTGARNIIIGSGADNLTATTSDYLNIGDAIYGVMDTDGTPAVGDGEASITIDGDLTVTGTISGAAGIFELNSGVVRNTGAHATEDFVFGSSQLDDSGDATEDSRFFFDKSKGAFRAGTVTGTTWDDASRGTNSVALGSNNEASGSSTIALGTSANATGSQAVAIGYFVDATNNFAVAIGRGTAGGARSVSIGNSTASTSDTVAIGESSTASGVGSIVLGNEVKASGISSAAIGLSDQSDTDGLRPVVSGDGSMGLFMDQVDSYDLSTTDTFGIIGGELMLDDDGTSPATKGCLRFDDTAGKLQFSHDCSTYVDMPNGGTVALPIDTEGEDEIMEHTTAGDTFMRYLDTDNVLAIGVNAGGGLTDGDGAQNNILIGDNAGNALTTGDNNTFIGQSAGAVNADGAANTFVGQGAGDSNTSGDNNTFMGRLAGSSNTTRSGSTLIGYHAGLSANSNQNVMLGAFTGAATSGDNNTFVGYTAGQATTTGTENVFIGHAAGDANIGGQENTFVGINAGGANTEGDYNVFIGASAGASNTTNSGIVAIGGTAGASNTQQQNTYVGYFAGSQNDALGNTMIGSLAGRYATGTDNTFIGNDAGGGSAGVTTASANTFVGQDAGKNTTSGGVNTFIGHNAGQDNTTGNSNVYIGDSAGMNNVDGSDNTVVGRAAGDAMTSASSNTLVGRSAGGALTTGDSNVIIGDTAGSSATTISQSVYIGYYAGNENVTGVGNTIIGGLAGRYATGRWNTFLGFGAGGGSTGVTTAESNTFLGYDAGGSTTSGGYNTFVGDEAGDSNTTGAANILIGEGVDKIGDATTSYEINIGNAIYGTSGTSGVEYGATADDSASIIIDGDLSVGNGGTAAAHTLDVGTDATMRMWLSKDTNAVVDPYNMGFNGDGGAATRRFTLLTDQGIRRAALQFSDMAYDDNIMFGLSSSIDSGSTWNAALTLSSLGDLTIRDDIYFSGMLIDTSDRRLKTDIVDLNESGSLLDRLAQIEGYKFRMKDAVEREGDEAPIEYGVMAQEIERVFPELVMTADDEMGTKSVNYLGLIAPIIEATKELNAQNQELEKRINEVNETMGAQIAALETSVKAQKSQSNNPQPQSPLAGYIIAAIIGMGGAMFMFLMMNAMTNRRKDNGGA